MDVVLSRKQTKLLNKIAKGKVIRTNKYDTKDIDYLHENGLVRSCSIDKKEDFFLQPCITEKGKAVLYKAKQEKRRFIFSTLFEAITAVIAVAAFVKSFFF